ncbi:MAG: hypothetical protein H7062_02670 [Candidatus Saccharimonas sp.]|nr:hypothetical protein [Planctomycetaceae bacterium]
MSIVRSLRLALIALIALSFVSVVGTSGLRAAEVSPLDLVGESAALCLEIPRLGETWKRIEHSRMAERVRAFSPFVRFVRGPGFQQWLQIEKYVAQATGQPLSEQLLGLCADSLVIAVYLPDGAKPQGIAIARARDSAALRQAVDAWGKLEPQHVDKTLQHRGQSYIQRAKSAGSKEVLFYTVVDRTLVLSDQEALVRQAIDFQQAAAARAESREPTGATDRLLRESPLYRAARARLRDDSAAFLHVNARAWDKALQEGAKNDPGAIPVLKVWQHVSVLAGSLRFDEGVALDVVAELDRERLPSGWAKFVQSSQATTGWADRIPSDALLAIAGRVDVRPLVQMWLAATPDAKSDDFARGRRVLRSLLAGRDLFDDVLPALLSDVTIHASAQNDVAVGTAPFELLGVLAWKAEAEEASSTEPPRLASSLDNALQFGLNVVAGYLAHELPESNVIVGSETTGKATIRWLKGLTPWEPAYGIAAQRLIVASSRAKLARGLATAPSNNAEPRRSSRLSRHEQRFFAAMTQLVWFDSAQTREALARHSDWLATMLSRRSPESKPKIASRLSHLGEVLQLFDAAFLAGSLSDDHVRVVFGGALD